MSIKSITIRNPLVVSQAERARDLGIGRDATEAAENLILDPRSAAEMLDYARKASCPNCASMTPAPDQSPAG